MKLFEDKTPLTELSEGSYEEMMKKRKAELPRMQEAIQRIFDDYDGGHVVVLRMKEDENADPEGSQLFIGGVGKLSSNLKMSDALREASTTVLEHTAESVQGDAEAMFEVLSHVAKRALKNKKESK